MAARLTAVLVAAIVGVTLIAGLIVGAQREDDSGPIDLLIYNGRVYTGRADAPFAEAVAVRGNRIYRVGSNRDVKRLRRRATTVVDAHGGSVLPGFTDVQAGLPIFVGEPSPVAPTVAATSGPRQVPPESVTDEAATVREAVEGAHRLGLTTVGVTLDGADALDEYERLRGRAELALRVVAAIRVVPPVSDAFLARIEALRAAPDADPMVRVDAIALDVTLPPAAAVKKSPVRGRRLPPATPAPPALSADEAGLVLALDKRGLPLVLRVDDERELAAALDALERAVAANPAPAGGRRHRLALVHPMPFDVERVKALRATVSLPLPAAWPADREMEPDAEVPTDAAPRFPSSFDGVRLVMASETLADPRLGLQALVASQAVEGSVAATTVDSDVLRSALRTLTTDAAAAQGDDRARGTIAKNMLADLVVLSADLFTLPPDKLLDAVVTLTILDGKVVFDRAADTPASTDQ